jgi:hypothetical protein
MRRQDFIKPKVEPKGPMLCIMHEDVVHPISYNYSFLLPMREMLQYSGDKREIIKITIKKCLGQMIEKIKNDYVKNSIFFYKDGVNFMSEDDPLSHSIRMNFWIYGKWDVSNYETIKLEAKDIEFIKLIFDKNQSSSLR